MKMERIPPHSEEAEKSVLGASMLDKDALYEASEYVKAEDFYNNNNKEIFEAITSLNAAGTPVDMLTVCEELGKRGSLEMVGGRGYVASLSSSEIVPSVSNAAEYAKIIAEKAELRRLITAASNIMDEGYKDSVDAKQVLDSAERQIFQITQNRGSQNMVPLEEVLMKNMEEIDKRAKMKGSLTGVPTGLIDLDNRTTGLQKSDLIILAARPSMGKTAFALCAARNAAAKGCQVLIFSLEMSRLQLSQRLISMESAVDSDRIRKGTLDQSEWDRIIAAADTLGSAPIMIDDTPGISILEIKNKCRRLKAEKGLDLIVLDYLQLMDFQGKADNRQQEITSLSRGLKQLAREMECPVLVLSQLSRMPETRNDHRPIMSDLRESGAIEQDADVILMLYRDEVYNPDTENPGVCEVNVAKQRNGPTGTVEVRWQSKYTKFVNKSDIR